jgi:hypothetical protein
MAELEPCGVQVILADGTLRTITCQRYAGHVGGHVGYANGARVTFTITVDEDRGEPKSWLREEEGILP